MYIYIFFFLIAQVIRIHCMQVYHNIMKYWKDQSAWRRGILYNIIIIVVVTTIAIIFFFFYE